MPSTTVTLPHIDSHEYAIFRRQLAPDGRLAPSYSRWYTDSLTVQQLHESSGLKVKRVGVTWIEFQAFATSTGLPYTYELLMTFARLKGGPGAADHGSDAAGRPDSAGGGDDPGEALGGSGVPDELRNWMPPVLYAATTAGFPALE